MCKKEIKVLLYVKSHKDITKKKLYQKFPFLESEYYFISDYLSVSNTETIIDDCGFDTGQEQSVDTSIYELSRNGILFLEKLHDDKIHRYFTPIFISILTNVIIFIGKLFVDNFSKIVWFIQNLF